MADIKIDNVDKEKDSKRKRSEQSSISDLDNSVSISKPTEGLKKKKKKTNKMANEDVARQLKQINEKLANVITKDDDSLKTLISETFRHMKDELLKSVSHRIDLLESKLFDKEQENDKLKEKIESIEKNHEEINALSKEKIIELEESNHLLKMENNSLEQYGRRNNILIVGVPETPNESAEQTSKNAAELLNAKLPNTNIRRCDIDIAHRLGPKQDVKPRTVIMRFVSRMTRDSIMRCRKHLKGTNIFINEDLTKLNHKVLKCVRTKMTDEVESAWSTNGKILYKHKDKSIKEVKTKDYQHWIDLP